LRFMSETIKPPDRVLPDQPMYRPLERFWPYAELAEQPSDEELAELNPELREALYGGRKWPFSISVVFPEFEGQGYAEALTLARAADEYVEVRVDGKLRHRARFVPGDRPLRLRDLYDRVSHLPDHDVLVDDRPVPFARELWLPLVWMLIR